MQNNRPCLPAGRGAQIFVACAAGGGIGALVALQLSQVNPWMAVIGGLAGMLTGYLAYDPMEVMAAFGRAFLTATQWYPDWTRVKESVVDCALMIGAGLTPMLVVLTFIYYSYYSLGGAKYDDLAFVGVALTILVSFMYLFYGAELLRHQTWYGLSHAQVRTLFKWLNPLTVLCLPIIALYWLARRLCWLIKMTPAAVSFLWGVTKTAFVLMHSNGRVLCAVDSLIGACVGYFAGNAIVGAIVGGLVGLLDYELVSKRLLKLVPVAVDKK